MVEALKVVATIVVIAGAAFAGGWFTHKETQQSCYVIPGYVARAVANPYLPADHSTPPDLVCK